MECNDEVARPRKAPLGPEIACRTCGAEPKVHELLEWYQHGLYWARSEREQLLCRGCFELLPVAERPEWIAVADMIVD